jgi:hypothetical protein
MQPGRRTRPPINLDHARCVRDAEGGTFEPAPEPVDEPGHIAAARSSMLSAYALGALTPHVGAGRASGRAT